MSNNSNTIYRSEEMNKLIFNVYLKIFVIYAIRLNN
jgi:hypothetical protein